MQRRAFTMQARSQSSRPCSRPRHRNAPTDYASTMRYARTPCKQSARRPSLAPLPQVQARTSTFSGQQLVSRRPFVARAARPSVAVVQAAGAQQTAGAARPWLVAGCGVQQLCSRGIHPAMLAPVSCCKRGLEDWAMLKMSAACSPHAFSDALCCSYAPLPSLQRQLRSLSACGSTT